MQMARKVGRPKKSPQKSVETREQILESARKLFAERGFDKTTIQDIVSEARVNLSLVSYYFGGKDQLYFACLEDASEYARQASEKVLSRPKSQEEFKIR